MLAGQPALEIVGVHVANRADLAGIDHLARPLDRVGVAIGEVDHIDDAGGLRRLHHRHGVLVVHRQGLFAEDMFACRDELQRGRLMDIVRRRIDGRVESAPGDRLVEAAEGLRDAVGFCKGLCALEIAVDCGDDLDRLQLAELFRVTGGNPARAEDDQTMLRAHL